MTIPEIPRTAQRFAGISLNTQTLGGRWSLAQAIEGCLRSGFEGIAPTRSDLRSAGPEVARRLIRDSGLAVTGLSRGGLFTESGPCGLRTGIEDTRRAIGEAAEIGARCLIVIAGGVPAGEKDLKMLRAQVREGLAQVVPDARDHGVKLALEPLHPTFAADRSVICDLTGALDVVDGLDVGIAVDTYHTWWDPRCGHELRRAGPARLLGFHVSDWVRDEVDRLNGRGMIGDGVIDLAAMCATMLEAGYRGFAEVEIISRQLMQRSPEEVLEAAMRGMRTVLASLGIPPT